MHYYLRSLTLAATYLIVVLLFEMNIHDTKHLLQMCSFSSLHSFIVGPNSRVAIMCQDRHVPGENYYSETAKTRGAAELQQAEAQSEHLDEQFLRT